MISNKIISNVYDIAKTAGSLILGVYAKDFEFFSKTDESPLTEADILAHNHICESLQCLTPDIPVLSEESEELLDSNVRLEWRRFWLIDPLDGTKEFIKKNGEFTVNIALIEDGVPVLGVVYAPALKIAYCASKEDGAFKVHDNGHKEKISVSNISDISSWRVVGSRSHSSPEFDSFIKKLPNTQLLSMGSSLKLCLVAEGKADLYPRLGPTSEWDTAAAQAVVEAAGGRVLVWPSLKPMTYNKKDTLLNPFFIVCSDISPVWKPSEIENTVGVVYERKNNDSKSEVIWHHTQVNKEMRAKSLKQKPYCIWLTGLSGSGKSTIANLLELNLHRSGKHTFLLDGDNVRHGLNKDLSMSANDRAENIRRIGELAKLMVDAGLIVVTAFISPFKSDRDKVRAMFNHGEFIEVFVDTPIEECERRDPKGLYQKAREGKIRDFTGIDSVYEQPDTPEVHLNAGTETPEFCVELILKALE